MNLDSIVQRLSSISGDDLQSLVLFVMFVIAAVGLVCLMFQPPKR